MSLSNEIHDCCPFCGGVGFTVYSYRGEPEQEQCQFCYERAYPLADKVKELEAALDKLRDVVRKHIVELSKFPRDPQSLTLCFNAMHEAVMKDTTERVGK